MHLPRILRTKETKKVKNRQFFYITRHIISQNQFSPYQYRYIFKENVVENLRNRSTSKRSSPYFSKNTNSSITFGIINKSVCFGTVFYIRDVNFTEREIYSL